MPHGPITFCVLYRRLTNLDNKKWAKDNIKGKAHVYRAKTIHARYLPTQSRHQFSYPVLFFGIDLDKLEQGQLNLDRAVFEYNQKGDSSKDGRSNRRKWRLCEIDPNVYFDPPRSVVETASNIVRSNSDDLTVAVSLDETIKAKLRKHLLPSFDGCKSEVEACTQSVYTVTMPKYIGFQEINPLTVHFCYAETGGQNTLAVVALEVSNTFGEKHLYVLRVGRDEDDDKSKTYDHTWTFPRAFHVSPFNDRSGYYRVSVVNPLKQIHLGDALASPRLDIKILTLTSSHEKKLFASLVGDGLPWSQQTIIASVLRWPASLLLTTPRILFQAAILHYRKWLDVFPRPEPFVAVSDKDENAVDQVNPVEFEKDGRAKEGGVQWQEEGTFSKFARERTIEFLKARVEKMWEVEGRRIRIDLTPADKTMEPLSLEGKLNKQTNDSPSIEKLEMFFWTPLMFDDLFICPTPQLALELGSHTERRWTVNNKALFFDVFSCDCTVKAADGNTSAGTADLRRLRRDVVKWGLSFLDDSRQSSLPRDLQTASTQLLMHPYDCDPQSTSSEALKRVRSQFKMTKFGYWLFVLFRARFVKGTEPWLEWCRLVDKRQGEDVERAKGSFGSVLRT
ncbi:hypothetical protein OIO90_001959 [Microbotryomycetes sp. JL221]|nr:hypothetical protein OIO90_001959 [Microbotryomycetes sp. JL221]